MNDQPQPITPKTTVDLTGMKVRVKSGEYIGRVGKVSTEISGRWVVELQGAGKKSKPTTEVFNAEQLHVMTVKKAQEYPTDTTALASDNAALKKLLESRDQAAKEATVRAEKLASELAAALKRIDGLQEDVTQRDQLLIMANKVMNKSLTALPKDAQFKWLAQEYTPQADRELQTAIADGWQVLRVDHHMHYGVMADGEIDAPLYFRQVTLWRKLVEVKPTATLHPGASAIVPTWVQTGVGSRLEEFLEPMNEQLVRAYHGGVDDEKARQARRGNRSFQQYLQSTDWQQSKGSEGFPND